MDTLSFFRGKMELKYGHRGLMAKTDHDCPVAMSIAHNLSFRLMKRLLILQASVIWKGSVVGFEVRCCAVPASLSALELRPRKP